MWNIFLYFFFKNGCEKFFFGGMKYISEFVLVKKISVEVVCDASLLLNFKKLISVKVTLSDIKNCVNVIVSVMSFHLYAICDTILSQYGVFVVLILWVLNLNPVSGFVTGITSFVSFALNSRGILAKILALRHLFEKPRYTCVC